MLTTISGSFEISPCLFLRFFMDYPKHSHVEHIPANGFNFLPSNKLLNFFVFSQRSNSNLAKPGNICTANASDDSVFAIELFFKNIC